MSVFPLYSFFFLLQYMRTEVKQKQLYKTADGAGYW